MRLSLSGPFYYNAPGQHYAPTSRRPPGSSPTWAGFVFSGGFSLGVSGVSVSGVSVSGVSVSGVSIEID
jgi:hypothetical protein